MSLPSEPRFAIDPLGPPAVAYDRPGPHDAFLGLAGYLAGGTPLQRIHVCCSTDKDAVLERVESYALGLRLRPRLRRAIGAVLDELLTNALYNAPVDADGVPRYARWPRTRVVQLDPEEAVALCFGSDGRRFGLSVVDHFGSLTPDRVRSELARCHRGPTADVRAGPGGAGLGLREVTSLSDLIIDIEPGRRTEVIGLLDVSESYRRLLESAKSVDIFVRGAPS